MGLNAVDAGHCNGWPGTPAACENDARDMAAIARANQFDTTVLVTRQPSPGSMVFGTTVRFLQSPEEFICELPSGA